MAESLPVDPEVLRKQVQAKYRDVALVPDGSFHFHTGRPLAARLGYDTATVAVSRTTRSSRSRGSGTRSSCAGWSEASGWSMSGPVSGFDTFIAAGQVGPDGRVVGVDMTPEMLDKSRKTADELGLVDRVEYREGLAEQLPVEDAWADVVISNGVINLCADKKQVFDEIHRVLRPGGWLQFADIANGRPYPPKPYATSTSGPAELRVGCPVRAGRRSSKRPASRTSPSATQSTPSVNLPARTMPAPSRCSAIRSSPDAHYTKLSPCSWCTAW